MDRSVTSHLKNGDIDNKYILKSGIGDLGIDTSPGIYHTFFAVEEDTVLFEVKPGPYDSITDKDFAKWAPAEGSEEVNEYFNAIQNLF